PVLFCTIVEGIVRHGAARDTGATVLRSLIVFLGITVAALAIGLGVAVLMQPGRGLPLLPYGTAMAEVERQLAGRHIAGPGDFLVRIVP
ncbi:cation:dicarboxylate symporter family transporter, partial [Rhizobium brockwellii]